MREVFKANSVLQENHAPTTAGQNGYCRRPAASDKGVVYLELSGFVYAERIVREEKKREQKKASQILLSQQGEIYVIYSRRPEKRQFERRDFNQKESNRVEGLCYLSMKEHVEWSCMNRRDSMSRGTRKGDLEAREGAR